MMPAGETARDPSGWTSDLLFIHLQTQLDGLSKLIEVQFNDMKRMLDERYSTQTKALDAAFVAQQTAMGTAFLAADKAVQAALLAAEKAVTKAEMASEKRFENVNEFRGQLADMQATLISRHESSSQFIALDEKFNARFTGLDEHVKRIQTTIDRGFASVDTKAVAGNQYWGYLVGGLGLVLTGVIIVMNVITTR